MQTDRVLSECMDFRATNRLTEHWCRNSYRIREFVKCGSPYRKPSDPMILWLSQSDGWNPNIIRAAQSDRNSMGNSKKLPDPNGNNRNPTRPYRKTSSKRNTHDPTCSDDFCPLNYTKKNVVTGHTMAPNLNIFTKLRSTQNQTKSIRYVKNSARAHCTYE